MIIPSIQFEWVSAVVFLLALPLIWGCFLFYSKFQKNMSRLLFFSYKKQSWKTPLFSIIWLLLTFAVMGPIGNPFYPIVQEKKNPLQQQEVIVKQKAHEIIFLLDTSRSMSVPDTRIGKSRLYHAQEIIDDIASELNGESASLFAFNSRLVPIVPDTYDLLFLRLMVQETRINEGGTVGTNLTNTLEQLKERIEKQPEEQMKSVIILSDGEETDSINGDLKKTLNELNIYNTRVYTIGIGTKKGETIPNLTYHGFPVTSHLEAKNLQKIAEIGRGVYFDANRDTTVDLAKIVTEKITNVPAIDRKQRAALSLLSNEIEGPQYEWFFQIPLACAILLLAFTILKEGR